MFIVQNQVVLLLLLDGDLLTAGEDLVASMLFVPLGQRGGHVHLLDDVSPTHTGVVGAEADLAFLGRVRNDALLRAAEVVVEEILEPHTCDEQEVPTIGAAHLDVFHRAVRRDLAVVAAGRAEALVELLQKIGDLEVLRCLRRIVVAQKSERHAQDREELAASGVVHLGNVLRQTVGVQERRYGNSFLRLLIDHESHTDTTVGMASAGELAPVGVRSVNQIGPVREGAHERDREPVTRRLAQTSLSTHVMREMRERITLCSAALVRNRLVTTGKGNRLERKEVDLLGVVESELDDASDLLVVDAVDDRRYGNDVDASLVQVMNGLQLYVEGVSNLAMRVGCVTDTVELQVGIAQTRFRSGLGKFLALGKFDTVGRSLHRVVTDLTRVSDSIEEVRRKRRLTTGELYRHLAAGLDLDRVVQHGLDLVPRQFVNETDLVRIHEAGIAHHVAAVRKIDGQHGATAMRDGRRAVIVQLLVIVGADIAAREHLLQMCHHLNVDRHEIFKMAVNRAVLHHQDLAVALDDLCLDLADLLVQKNLVRQLAVNDLLADLGDTLRAERVRRTGPTEGRLFLLVALQKGLIAPAGCKARVGADAIELLKDSPSSLGRQRKTLLY